MILVKPSEAAIVVSLASAMVDSEHSVGELVGGARRKPEGSAGDGPAYTVGVHGIPLRVWRA